MRNIANVTAALRGELPARCYADYAPSRHELKDGANQEGGEGKLVIKAEGVKAWVTEISGL
jgi:hypothetical protein